MKKSSNRAFTLLEVVFGFLVAGIVMWVVAGSVKSSLKAIKGVEARKQSSDSCEQIANDLLRNGRSADSCSRVSGAEFSCTVDLNNPATPSNSIDDTILRFFYTKNIADPAKSTLQFQEQTTPGNWKTRGTHANITTFEVCDDARMAASSCPIEPKKLSEEHMARLGPPPYPSRYFRFQVNVGDDLSGCSLRSGFFVRNPTQFGSTSTLGGKVSYQARMTQ